MGEGINPVGAVAQAVTGNGSGAVVGDRPCIHIGNERFAGSVNQAAFAFRVFRDESTGVAHQLHIRIMLRKFSCQTAEDNNRAIQVLDGSQDSAVGDDILGIGKGTGDIARGVQEAKLPVLFSADDANMRFMVTTA